MKKSLRIFLLVVLFLTLSACAIPATLFATMPVASPAPALEATPAATPGALPAATLGALPGATPTASSAPLETAPDNPTVQPSPSALPVKETALPAISHDVLRNFPYWLTDFNTTAAFQDGVLQEQGDNQPGGQHLSGQIIEPIADGDLNGDGLQDAALILAINSGGSGTFFYLVAVLDQDGAPVQAASAWIGDRQAVRNLQIADGKIVLDFLTQGPNDPLCCPSQHRLRSYQLENGTLQVKSDEVVN